MNITNLTTLKVIHDKGVLLGTDNGEFALVSFKQVDKFSLDDHYRFVNIVKPTTIEPNVEKLAVTHTMRIDGEEQVASIQIDVSHLVDLSCAIAFDPMSQQWYVDDNVSYSRKQIRIAENLK